MTQKNKDIKEYVARRDLWVCQACGKYIGLDGCLAHSISKSKMNYKLYGKEVIDNPLNLHWSCITNECNDSFNIGNNPGKIKELLEEINDKNR